MIDSSVGRAWKLFASSSGLRLQDLTPTEQRARMYVGTGREEKGREECTPAGPGAQNPQPEPRAIGLPLFPST